MDSSGFQMKFINEEKGRGLFARKKYNEGDVIFEEQPIVCCQFAWNEDYRYLACEYCLRPLETAEENARRLTANQHINLPFPEYCETKKHLITECEACDKKYCSTECKSEAWMKYHQSLCLRSKGKNENHPLVQLKEAWKQMQYPPETATIMLFAKIIAMINQSNDKAEAVSVFSQFCNKLTSNDQGLEINFLGEKFVEKVEVLRQMLQQTVNTEYVPHWFTSVGFQNLIALIGVNAQGIGTSPFSTWVKKVLDSDDSRENYEDLIDSIYDQMDEVVGSFLNVEGSGLFSTQSLINHSCFPNAVVEFPYSNSTLVVKALRSIQPEEEITISYLNECEQERSRHSRQKALSSFYLFKCVCAKCLQQFDDPDVTSDDNESTDSVES